MYGALLETGQSVAPGKTGHEYHRPLCPWHPANSRHGVLFAILRSITIPRISATQKAHPIRITEWIPRTNSAEALGMIEVRRASLFSLREKQRFRGAKSSVFAERKRTFPSRSRGVVRDDRNDDALRSACAQHTGRFVRSGSGGQHVVNEDHCLPRQVQRPLRRECTSDVGPPLFGIQVHLLGRMPHAPQDPRQQFQLQHSCHRSGQNFTLIITATPAPAPMERNGNCDIWSMRF